MEYLDKRIEATAKSLHVGQKGTVVADYGNYVLVKADDETYNNSFTSSGREGKYFQVDTRLIKAVKD